MTAPTRDTIYTGDGLDVMRGWPDGCVPLVLTDIPYGAVSRASSGLRTLDKGDADRATCDPDTIAFQLARIASGSIYVFCGTEQVSPLRAQFVELGLTTRMCVWEKTNPSPMNGQHLWLSSVECCVFARRERAVFTPHCKSPVWRYPVAEPNGHPTPKPARMMEMLIMASSEPGDVVCDPFAGSGTTLVAAIRTGRRYVGIELNPAYVAIAQRRIAAARHMPFDVDDATADKELPLFAGLDAAERTR